MIRDIMSGFSAYLTAIQLTIQHRLWGYFFAPALICIALGTTIFYTAWNLSSNVGFFLERIYPFEWGSGLVESVGQVFGGVLILAVGLILFKNLVIVLASPFMSYLSEKVERILHGGASPKFSFTQFGSDMIRGLRIAIRLVVRELFFTLLLMVAGLFLPFLAPAIPILILVVQSYYAGAGNIDFTLERYYRVRSSVQFVRQHKGLAIGNGAPYLFLYLTVVGFLFALPLSTIAGTVETMKKLDTD
ncbi:MAG: EI24 domain-containing protein [Bacteroidota bacterium]